MSETTQIVLGVIFLIVVYILTRFGIASRMKKTAERIIRDIKRQDAIDPASAVDLPYKKPSFFHIGMRDYGHKALESLVQDGTVGKTDAGKYYLKKG